MSSPLYETILAAMPYSGAVDMETLRSALGEKAGSTSQEAVEACVAALCDMKLLTRLPDDRLQRAAATTCPDPALAELLASLATTMINAQPEESDQHINWTLEQVSRFVEVDRGYIFRYDMSARLARYTHEWCAPGISPQIDHFAAVPLDGMESWLDSHQRGEMLVVEDVDNWHDESVREILQAQNIRSTAAVPLINNGECIGFVGFDVVRNNRHFSKDELRLLQMLARMLVSLELRSRQQQALQHAQQQLESVSTIIRHSPVVAMRWENRPGWPVGFVSDNISRFGYESEHFYTAEIIYSDLIHPDDLSRVQREVSNYLDQGPDTYRQEYRLRHAEGYWIWIEDFTWLTRDSQGKVSAINGVLSDITSRVEAEQALNDSEQRFRGLLENIESVAVQGYDENKQVIFWNRGSELLYGYSRDEAAGKSLLDLIIPLEMQEFVEAEIEQALADGVAMPSAELSLQNKHGEPVPVFSSHAMQRNTRGGLELYCIDIDLHELRQSQQRLAHLARYDELTGLANRARLGEHLRSMLQIHDEQDTPLAVVYIDLDGFNAINEQYGYSVGDRYLMEVAERLQALLKKNDMAARPGGDEFILVLNNMHRTDTSDPTLRQLSATLSEPIQVDALTLPVSASIGVSFYPQAISIDADQLLRQADQAMYSAKTAGKARISFFDPALEEKARARSQAAQYLQQAVTREELRLHYQPKVDLLQGRVYGIEALLRWQHPENGLCHPDQFLSLMESDIELNRSITSWVIDQALADLESLRMEGHQLGVSINVNLAAQHEGSEDFVAYLAKSLARHPALSAQQLTIEILESTVIEDMERISRIINAARNLGVGFSLDDFGTGYSSLTYLKNLPLDEIKIDRSFVRDMLSDSDDMSIVKGIVSLAHAFHIPVIAEGVESQAHALRLLEVGCHLAQGYAIAQPMPLSDLRDWLAQWQPDPVWHNAAIARYAAQSVGTTDAGSGTATDPQHSRAQSQTSARD